MEAEAVRLAVAVHLLPVGTLPTATLRSLAARLSRRIGLPCRVLPARRVPLERIPIRAQVDAGALLSAIETETDPSGALLVGLTGEDIAVPVFTFVFGLARQGGAACVVSLARTDPEFYGLPPNPDLRDERAVAEILHEMGHLATLAHCPDRGCLMSFAGTIERVDTRGSRFCRSCALRLPRWLRGSEGSLGEWG